MLLSSSRHFTQSPASNIQYHSIQHPVSSIQYLVSSFQYPASRFHLYRKFASLKQDS